MKKIRHLITPKEVARIRKAILKFKPGTYIVLDHWLDQGCPFLMTNTVELRKMLVGMEKEGEVNMLGRSSPCWDVYPSSLRPDLEGAPIGFPVHHAVRVKLVGKG